MKKNEKETAILIAVCAFISLLILSPFMFFLLSNEHKTETVYSNYMTIKNKYTKVKPAEKADQMYYEEMFSQPTYDKRFIGMHPDLKGYFVRKVPGKEIFYTELNIDFADGTWQLSVDERTTELVKAQFSKDGKFVLVGGMKEGNAIINISREDETYGGSILVRVEEPEEWYEKLQEEILRFEASHCG